ncbi:MAG TPA: beta-N-acetylhexosaminidase [Nitrospiria bacterium]|nr:beta-N-acetylhexosaminidase [Nitrospiria bacterium]
MPTPPLPTGQLLVVGFDGTAATPRLKRLIQKERIGGVILFSRNIESPRQLSALTAALRKSAGERSLLIGIDQEGGRVQRLPKPFTQWPPVNRLGAAQSHDLAYQMGQAIGLELSAVGVNLDFAPVLDVGTATKNPIIGDRAFSHDPAVVAALGLAFIVGLQDQGVIACGKHFPGHGDTSVDSHKALPVVTAKADTLLERELKPFRHAIENRLAAIMTAHVRYLALDPEWPATLSPAILTTLLRETLGFDGVVFTDDLEMKGITDHWAPELAAVQAIKAGADSVLVCKDPNTQDAVLEELRRAVADGTLPPARIQQSLARLDRLKAQFAVDKRKSPAPSVIGCEEHQKLAHRLAKA